MVKTCSHCEESFKTKDSRQQTCSKECRYAAAKLSPKKVMKVTLREVPQQVQRVPQQDLPDPRDLPATYVKQVHDLWRSLLGDKEYPTRIL